MPKQLKPKLNLDALTLQSTPAAKLAQGHTKDATKAITDDMVKEAMADLGWLDDDLVLGSDLDDDDAGSKTASATGIIGLEQLESDLETGVSEMLLQFQKSTAGESATRDANINTRYWFALAFQTEAAKREFLTKIGWIDLGDKYFCGEEIANRLGIEMTIPLPNMPNWRAKASLRALSTDRSDAAHSGDTD